MTIEKQSRQILIHGLILIFTGLVWGLVVPHTPYPRLALGAHIQFELSGLLYIAMAVLLLTLPNAVGRKSIIVMLIAVWLTWIMAISEAANAWWGTIEMLPLAGHQASARGGAPWQEAVVMLTHIAAGLGLIAAWLLLTIGFIKSPAK